MLYCLQRIVVDMTLQTTRDDDPRALTRREWRVRWEKENEAFSSNRAKVELFSPNYFGCRTHDGQGIERENQVFPFKGNFNPKSKT